MPRSALHRRLMGARAALLVEAVWPLVVPVLALILCFLALAWLGLFTVLPIWLRIGVVAVFGVALLFALAAFRQLSLPDDRMGRARLDRDSGLKHRPVVAASDQLGNGAEDATTAALWRLHQAQAERQLASVRVKRPRPDVARRDPVAWRYASLLAAFAAFFVAGPEWQGRLLAAFDWQTPPVPQVPPRIDAWVDPPSYTGRAPIFLSRAEKPDAPDQKIAVPVGSTIVVRVTPPDGMSIETNGQFEAKTAEAKTAEAKTVEAKATDAKPSAPVRPAQKPAVAGAAPTSLEQRYTVAGDGSVTVRSGSRVISSYALSAIPDKAPSVAFLGLERATKGDGLTLKYRVEDDYGVAGGVATFEALPGKDGSAHRTLGEAPSIALVIPGTSGAPAEAEVSADLSDHPWAGTKVRIKLSVKDDPGQVGESAPAEVVIPQRPFSNPLAKALVEQRRSIVMNPDERQRPLIALSALMSEPEAFETSLAVYTGLKIASTRLHAARSDAQLLDVADWLWGMALEIEDGGLSKAEKELRAAQERLREAIDRGASPDEIKRLAEDLKRAMDRYMREFAQKNRNDKQNQAQRDPNAKTLNQDDLRKILEKIEELTKNGQFAEAQRLLEKLNEMMKNLQTAEGGGGDGQDQRSSDLDKQADELDKLTRDEQRLRDRTYREGQERQRGQQQGQNGQGGQQQGQPRQGSRQQGQQQGQQGQRGGQQNGQGQKGQSQQGQGQGQQGQGQQGQGQGQGQNDQTAEGDQGGTGGGTLENRQQRLRDQLGQLQRRLKELGAEGEQGLGEAEDAMRDSERALREGQNGQAVDSQGRALDGLRKGARGLAQQLQKSGEGRDQALGEDQPGRLPNSAQTDPLGRNPLDRGNAQNGGQNDGRLNADGRGGGTIEERARAVLDELRRRLGEATRPQIELEYVERLLRGN